MHKDALARGFGKAVFFARAERRWALGPSALAAVAALGGASCTPTGPAAASPPAPSAPSSPVASPAPPPGAVDTAQQHGEHEPPSAGSPGEGSVDQSAPAEAAVDSPTSDQAPPAALPLPPGTKVLHVGDSFAGALGIPLGEMLERAGVRSILKHKDSSYLTTWAWEAELAQEIWRYNPDLVVVTLGANELGIADPSQREKTVRKIVSTIGDRPCLWVAIPLWSERHNGLLDVIEASSAPCVFYDTNERLDTLHMPRIHDGIHPTNAARRAWAEAVFDYLVTHRDPGEGRPWRLATEAVAPD